PACPAARSISTLVTLTGTPRPTTTRPSRTRPRTTATATSSWTAAFTRNSATDSARCGPGSQTASPSPWATRTVHTTSHDSAVTLGTAVRQQRLAERGQGLGEEEVPPVEEPDAHLGGDPPPPVQLLHRDHRVGTAAVDRHRAGPRPGAGRLVRLRSGAHTSA